MMKSHICLRHAVSIMNIIINTLLFKLRNNNTIVLMVQVDLELPYFISWEDNKVVRQILKITSCSALTNHNFLQNRKKHFQIKYGFENICMTITPLTITFCVNFSTCYVNRKFCVLVSEFVSVPSNIFG